MKRVFLWFTLLVSSAAAANGCAQGQQADQSASSSADVSSSSSTGGSGGSGGSGGIGGMGGSGGTGGMMACAGENQPCDDGLYCTENDTCQGGVCSGTPKFCGSMDSCHVGVCDEQQKKCIEMAGNDGAQCDDGDPCTQNGTCSSGKCSKGPAIDCSFFNTPCSQGFCDPQNGCTFKPINDGSFCDDGKGGQCSQGSCKAGMCVSNPLNDGAPCDDMQFNDCTHGVCTAGSCVSNPQPQGTPCNGFFFNTCEDGQCDGASNCAPVPKNEGADCDDQMFNPCTQGKCMAGNCISHPKMEGAPCDDGHFCTINDTCQSGFCLGVINPCAPPQGDPCHTAICNDFQGCILTAGNDGAACDDLSACTSGETCLNGACQGGAPVNDGLPCNDNSACTVSDACNAGVCKGNQVVQCMDNDGCCPAGCTLANDSDCQCGINIALQAIPSTSGGGASPNYGPDELNNQIGPSCSEFCWIQNGQKPSGAWFEYDWPAPVTVGSFYVETDNGQFPMCGSSGRNLASATVQYWSNGAWVNAGSWANQHGNIQYNMPIGVSTTKLRLFDVTSDPGNGNSLIFEWHVYSGNNCVPPP